MFDAPGSTSLCWGLVRERCVEWGSNCQSDCIVLCCQVTSPGDRGHTQLAITRPRGGAGGGADTPSSEPGFSLTDQLNLTDWEEGDEMLSAEHMTAKLGFTK